MNGHHVEPAPIDESLPLPKLIGLENGVEDLSREEKEFLEMVKTVSDELDECASSSTSSPASIIQQHHQQRFAIACTSAAEELAMLPAAIAICEFN